MFKQFVTLIRGRSHDLGEAVVDQNALGILRQQIRDCAEAVAHARRAVAVAIAQNDQEVNQCKRVVARIADLEQRAIAALETAHLDLAQEAAESIALLETERDVSLAAQATFTSEIARIKKILRQGEARLNDIERGQRIAAVTEKTQQLRERGAGSTLNALRDAEATLSRLQNRQRQMEVADLALTEMELSGDPQALVEKLAEAGCGPTLKTSAGDVLKRLQLKTNSTIAA